MTVSQDANGWGARSVVGRTAATLVGLVIPAVVALVALPALNRYFGTSRVGFLALAWAIIGYAGVLDFGLGRAVTLLVAERLHRADSPGAASALLHGVAVLVLAGTAIGLIMGACASTLAVTVVAVPSEMEAETTSALRVLAVAVPLTTLTSVFRGTLEAQGRFMLVSMIRGPLGAWLTAAPLLLIPFGWRDLTAVAIVLSMGRLFGLLAFASSAVRELGVSPLLMPLRKAEFTALLGIGGWITVSNVVSPLMSYMDRFLLSATATLKEVAWYSSPWEIVTKMLVVPNALSGVLFPLFAQMPEGAEEERQRIMLVNMSYIALALFPPALCATWFAEEWLAIWMGIEFARHAYPVVGWISAGVLLNGMATIPYASLQASKRPHITAMLHVAELPVYCAAVYWLTRWYGIEGTAAAWTGRVGLDLFGLWTISGAGRQQRRRTVTTALMLCSMVALLAAGSLPLPMVGKVLALALVLAGEALFLVRVALPQDGLRLEAIWSLLLSKKSHKKQSGSTPNRPGPSR